MNKGSILLVVTLVLGVMMVMTTGLSKGLQHLHRTVDRYEDFVQAYTMAVSGRAHLDDQPAISHIQEPVTKEWLMAMYAQLSYHPATEKTGVHIARSEHAFYFIGRHRAGVVMLKALYTVEKERLIVEAPYFL